MKLMNISCGGPVCLTDAQGDAEHWKSDSKIGSPVALAMNSLVSC